MYEEESDQFESADEGPGEPLNASALSKCPAKPPDEVPKTAKAVRPIPPVQSATQPDTLSTTAKKKIRKQKQHVKKSKTTKVKSGDDKGLSLHTNLVDSKSVKKETDPDLNSLTVGDEASSLDTGNSRGALPIGVDDLETDNTIQTPCNNLMEKESFVESLKENTEHVDDNTKVEMDKVHSTTIPESEQADDGFSWATSNVVRGVGQGLSTLADVLSQAIQSATCDEPSNETERRERRLAEEKTERQAISQAWSNVWNSAWGTESGWGDDEDSQLPDLDKSETAIPDADHPHDANKNEGSSFWNWSGVSSLAQQFTTSFQTKGLNLVHEGVSVLEKIGKKTMSVIEENDPGFQYTKNFLRPPGLRDRPNLSQMIREAHARSQASSTFSSNVQQAAFNQNSLSSHLERSRALVHLEALELVSDQAESQLHVRLDQLPEAMYDFTSPDGLLEAIWRTFQLEDSESDDSAASTFSDPASLKLLNRGSDLLPNLYGCQPDSVAEDNQPLWTVLRQGLDELKLIYPGTRLLKDLTDIWCKVQDSSAEIKAEEHFVAAITSLAEVTSAYLEYLHKFAECILVRNHEAALDFSWLSAVVASLFQAALKLQTSICSEYIKLIKLVRKPSQNNEPEKPVTSTTQLVANVLLECNNAQGYLKNAAHLLVPVFQLACINSSLEDQST